MRKLFYRIRAYIWVRRGAILLDRRCPGWAAEFGPDLRDYENRPLFTIGHGFEPRSQYVLHTIRYAKGWLKGNRYGFYARNYHEQTALQEAWERQIARRVSHDFDEYDITTQY